MKTPTRPISAACSRGSMPREERDRLPSKARYFLGPALVMMLASLWLCATQAQSPPAAPRPSTTLPTQASATAPAQATPK